MRGKISHCFILFVLSSISACAANPVTVEKISAQVSEQGAKHYLNETMANRELWFKHIQVLQDGLNAADEKALKTLSDLRVAGDAGAGETLNFMIARAIPHNPELVASAVGAGFKLEGICNVPFIEEDDSVVKDYINNTRFSLKQRYEEGDALAGECLKILNTRLAKKIR